MYTLEDLVNDKELTGIINDYWKDYVKHRNLDFVVKPSIPIIWFGDLVAYKNSKVKVVTIGTNPSAGEFGEGIEKNEGKASFHRFRDAEKLVEYNDLDDDKNRKTLIRCYSDYFKKDNLGKRHAYDTWFERGYEKFFKSFPVYASVSYGYQNAQYTAIHIDCQTALATTKNWNDGVGKNDKRLLHDSSVGMDLYNRLFKYLDPHVIVSHKNQENEPIIIGDDVSGISQKVKSKNGKDMVVTSYKIKNKFYVLGPNYGTPWIWWDPTNQTHIDAFKKIFGDCPPWDK